MRRAMRFVAEGLAVPTDPAMDDVLLRQGDTVWRASENDSKAFGSFLMAARCRQAGNLALVSLAAATPSTQVARRALAALARVGVRDPESCVPLLLHLLERDDPLVQSLASRLLLDCDPKAPALQRAIVERALSNWPQDNERLCFDVSRCGSSGDDAWCSATPERLRWAWVAIAARTGDRAVAKRLLEWCRPKEGAAPGARLLLAAQCLAQTSARVDTDTARELHSVFMPLFLLRRGQGPADEGGRAIASIVLDVLPLVPPELLPSYAPLLDPDFPDAALRRRARCGLIPGDRLHLLILPIDREYDRDLMLRTPDRVVAALRGSEQERAQMIRILDGTAAEERAKKIFEGPSTRDWPCTRADWKAVLPAIHALGPAQRDPLLSRLEPELRRVAVEVARTRQ